MIRLFTSVGRNFSKLVEAPKKYKLSPKAASVPIEIYERQRLNKLYLQFQATPSDPLSMIQQRFIRKKKILSNRRLYMPNKKEYFLQLDSYLRQIEQKQDLQMIRDNYVVPKTIGQKIAYELQQQKLKFLYDLIYKDTYVIGATLVVIIAFTFFEQNSCQIPIYIKERTPS